MKETLLFSIVLALAAASASAAAPKFVKINGSTTRGRIQKVLDGDLRRQNRLTPADVNGSTITSHAAVAARQTEGGFEGLHATHAVTYVAPYTTRAGNPKAILLTVSGAISPATPAGQPPMARRFVARSGSTGLVVGRGSVDAKGKYTWTRGKNGDGLPERNLAE